MKAAAHRSLITGIKFWSRWYVVEMYIWYGSWLSQRLQAHSARQKTLVMDDLIC